MNHTVTALQRQARGGPATKHISRTARGGTLTSPEQSSGGLDSQAIVQEDPQGSSQAADAISFGAIWPGLPLSLAHIPSFLSFIRACHLVAGHTIRCFGYFTVTTIISRSSEEKNYLGNCIAIKW